MHTSDIFERSCFRDEIPTLARTNMHAMTNFCNLAARLYPFHAQSSAKHEISAAQKTTTKKLKMKIFLAFRLSDVVFIILNC